jgi:tryptophan-rich sensory protein
MQRAGAQALRLADSALVPHFRCMSQMSQKAGTAPRPVWVDALIAIVPVVAVSLLGNAVTMPQIPSWYPTLVKPPFNPPNWIFGPVWTTLFALMAFGVWRILRLPAGTPGKGGALVAYHVQLALNLAWSCVFFGLHSLIGGIVVIVPFLAMILVTIASFRPLDRLAANLQWPYVAWVSFATLLNVSIWWLNR